MAEAVQPVGPEAFARLIETLGLAPDAGPVAVAVSGGADSMALALLAAGWGDAVALTVDHGLRPQSAAEAERVGGWMAARGIAHHVLRWEAEKPESGLQAAARSARYRLMEEWCRKCGIGALLLAHHRDDQAETLLLRLARGSGLWGLAGMAAVEPPLSAPYLHTPMRYRPLLGIAKAQLVATCRAAGQDWIEDPSNRDPAYARTRARALLADPPLPGLDAARLAETAARLRRAREALEVYVERLMKSGVRFDPAGYAELSRSSLSGAPREIGLRTLERVLTAVAGRDAPPRGERVEQAYDRVIAPDFAGLTTLGCQLVPRRETESVAVCREPAAVAGEVELAPGVETVWDGRFLVRNRGNAPCSVGPLGAEGWRALAPRLPDAVRSRMPAPASRTLPALRTESGGLAVPALSITDGVPDAELRFLPLIAPRAAAAG